MTKNNGFKVAALAASIALAMGATSAFAADPAAGQLPGQGKVVVGAGSLGTVNVDNTTHVLDVDVGASTVINWGAGTATTDINNTGTAGFNVGSGATVNFTGAFPVLNIDSTGNASQIFGAVTAADDVFVANSNGIIVGSGGSITSTGGDIGLVANTLIGTNGGFTGTLASINFNGAGGDVTLASGSTLDAGGNAVIVSGGGNVNLDLGAITAGDTTTFSAGVAQNAVPDTPNASANVAITGGTLAAGATLNNINSAGTVTNAATVDLSSTTMTGVKGVFTNNGDATIGGSIGKVVNQGQLNTSVAGVTTFKSLTNSGAVDGTSGTGISVGSGGNLTNTGSITGAGVVTVSEGNINNSGSIADVTSLTTLSNSTNTGYAAGSQYFINNTGSITSTGALTVTANTTHGGAGNDSTGSFTNTGTLTVGGAASALTVNAYNNISLGGTLKAGVMPAALSSSNPLGAVTLNADANSQGAGVLTVSAPLFGAATGLSGNQVKVMSNVTGTTVGISADDALTTDYAVRVAAGTTTKGSTSVTVAGRTVSNDPNTILQGTISAPVITFGSATNAVGDIISGPAGGLVASGATPAVNFNFAGRLKTAPYLNNANNFRYNYLPISLTSSATSPLALTLNAAKYATNGTSNGKAGVNLLVNGDVTLTNTVPGGIDGTGSAVTGVTNTPNTHLVLQSTGDISTAGYWPGYVYLGTIDSDSNGKALPGTLSSTGKITLTADFNNVLPGDVAGASGIHFMSGNALVGAVDVTTNANAWINFPTDLLTQSYTAGLITTPTFYAGTATGLIVNYAPFTVGQTEKLFNTHPVDATK